MLATALVEEKIINYRTIVRLHLCSCQSQQSVDSKNVIIKILGSKNNLHEMQISPLISVKNSLGGLGGVGGGVGVISVTKHTQQMS